MSGPTDSDICVLTCSSTGWCLDNFRLAGISVHLWHRFIFLSSMKNPSEVQDRAAALCSHVCSKLSSECLPGCVGVTANDLCALHRGCFEGVTLPRAPRLPIPFSVFFTCHGGSHTVSGAPASASVLGFLPSNWLTDCFLFVSAAEGDVQARAWQVWIRDQEERLHYRRI